MSPIEANNIRKNDISIQSLPLEWKNEPKSLFSSSFFDIVRDTIVSQPYAVLCSKEVNKLISQADTLANKENAGCSAFGHACALRQADHDARSDGEFPIVVLPQYNYQAALSHLRVT